MNFLSEISEIWSWLTGLILGLGINITVVFILAIVLFIKYIALRKRVQYLENRIISAERDLSLRITKIESR